MSVFLEVGDRIPLDNEHLSFFPSTLKGEDLKIENLKYLQIDDVFGDKNVILIGVQGAFISDKQVKNIFKNFENIKNHSLIIVAINDPWVTKSWADSFSLPKNTTICSDVDGRFTEMIGMMEEFPIIGRRSKEYSMLIKNSIVRSITEGGKEGWEIWNSSLLGEQ